MSATLRRTPCVGICSTTYGDLVCRGCKRFAHEIVQWNGLADEQRQRVWDRLHRLREGAVLAHVRIVDLQRVRDRALRVRVPETDTLTAANLVYEVLRRSRRGITLEYLGLEAMVGAPSTAEVYDRIEQELYQRAVAQYERDFRVLAQ